MMPRGSREAHAHPLAATSRHGKMGETKGAIVTDSGGTQSTWAAPDGSAPVDAPAPSQAPPPNPEFAVPPPMGSTDTPPLDPGVAPGAVSYAMYKPGIIVLRPLGFGEILDGGIKALRHNPKVMLGLNSIIVLVSQVALFGLGFGYFDMILSLDVATEADLDPGAIIAFFVGAIVSSLILTATSAVTSVSVGRSVIGDVISVGDAWRAAWKRTPTVLLMTLIMIGAAAVGYLIVLLPAILLIAVEPALGVAAMVLLALGFVVAAVWLGIKLSIAIPAAVLEKLGPIAAMKRSWRLTTGRFWMIFAILAVATIITSVIQNVISLPVIVILPLAAVLSPGATSVLFVVVLALATFVGVLISIVFLGGITAVLYTDQRMRREGFDLALTRAAMARYEQQ